MLLHIDRVSPSTGGAHHVERLTEGVVAVEWVAENVSEEALRVHLHVGDGRRPPVDVALDGRTGALVSAQVVVQDEAVPEAHVFGLRLPVEGGVPVVDVTPWRGEEQILDHPVRPTLAWEPAGTLTVRIARTSGLPAKEFSADGFSVVVDPKNLVLGFRIAGLDADERALVAEASSGS